jgi:hypothetical protein
MPNRSPGTGDAVMMQGPEDDPHVGGTPGAASQPRREEPESAGSGDVEIPIGIPVSDEEFRRLKAGASTPRDDRAEPAQEDAGQDDST